MKIDIRHLRWIFLGLYVVIVAGLFAMGYAVGDDVGICEWPMNVWAILVLLVTVASQVLFVYGAGTINLCRPIGRRRLLAPVAIAAFMMTVLMAASWFSLTELFEVDGEGWEIWDFLTLVGVSWIGWCVFFFVRYRQAVRFSVVRGVVTAVLAGSLAALLVTIFMAASYFSLIELSEVDVEEGGAWIFWTLVGVNWIGWCVFFFVRYRQAERFSVVRGVVTTVLAGSLAELLIAVPSHIIVSRRPGCFVGMLTATGLAGGLLAMLWAFGPGIILLFLQERRKKELAERIQQTNAP